MKFYFKIIIFIFTIFIFYQSNIYSMEKAKIVLKINNEIITNVDIKDEYTYLTLLNNDLKKIKIDQGLKIAKESLIKEKIKKNELEKFFDLSKEVEILDNIIVTFYKQLGLNNEKEFKSYLKKYKIKYQVIRKKIQIETTWNEFIYRRFNDQVEIDSKKLKQSILKQKNNQDSYLLFEILFKGDEKTSINQKYKLIKDSIKSNGFKNSANLYSVSDTAKLGGKIGWINENQLSKKIVKEIKNLKVGEHTKPITITSGQLILKLEDKRKSKINVNIDLELKKLESYERNKQLNQMSNIYFSKIKNNTLINEF
jgi:peptidyl-prolyl cis-trans isomerase SurA